MTNNKNLKDENKKILKSLQNKYAKEYKKIKSMLSEDIKSKEQVEDILVLLFDAQEEGREPEDIYEGDFEEYSDLTSRDWSMFIPLPFKNGDIVKVADPFRDTYYGVFVGEWKRPDKRDQLSMTIGIDVYIAENGKDQFDCTDDTEILCLEYCKDEELPRNQNVLKLLRDVRKGKKDILSLLYNFGKLQEFAGDFC